MKYLGPLLLIACTPTLAPQLTTDTQPVTVRSSGPGCAERCASLKEQCGALIPSTCMACDDSATVATCLEQAQTDCLEAGACLRGAPSRPFAGPPSGTGVKDLVGPFTLTTFEGTWRFEHQWTGDDSVLVLIRSPSNTAIFDGALRPLLEASPRNVQYLFGYHSTDQGFSAVRARWLAELQALPEADRLHWLSRVHFVATPMNQGDGWVEQLMAARLANPPRYLGNGLTSFAIDRFQRLREVGMLGRLTSGGTAADLRLLAKEAEAFNFEFDRARRLEATPARVITVATAQVVHDTLEADVMLPTAEELASFDTLEADLSLDCPEHLSANCGAWDYLSHLRKCTARTQPDGGAGWACDDELARWITSYWREGRWVTDLSALLPRLQPGGPTHLQWTANGQFDPRRTDYVVSLSLRFSTRGRALRAVSATPLWSGGALNAGYDALHPTLEVMVPADAVKVELVTLLTGHGGVQPTNCAEFCDHEHHFTVNGAEVVQRFPEATTPMGCADRVNEGVVPNQHGTWYFGRGGWCPGFDVAPRAFDVTVNVRLGQVNQLGYQARFGGQPVTQSLGNVVLSSWLVVWK